MNAATESDVPTFEHASADAGVPSTCIKQGMLLVDGTTTAKKKSLINPDLLIEIEVTAYVK